MQLELAGVFSGSNLSISPGTHPKRWCIHLDRNIPQLEHALSLVPGKERAGGGGPTHLRGVMARGDFRVKRAAVILLRYNVNVGFGVNTDCDIKNARFEIAWAALDSSGNIAYAAVLALAAGADELLMSQGGGIFDAENEIVGVASPPLKKASVNSISM
ncbi:hypothetical protein B0H17DRAFT_1151052 [Mycena rosella]|uniref:Uncharacterized protein n=1 Tax=Mycena rosella TaxID=1033263 RepID=A0AAD7BNY4_MYCRO|nr:hypothetical protein B0H17DRAFT_1151052 [Mycena rosella]